MIHYLHLYAHTRATGLVLGIHARARFRVS